MNEGPQKHYAKLKVTKQTNQNTKKTKTTY